MSEYDEDIRDRFQPRPDKRFRLKDFDPGWAGDQKLSKERRKEIAHSFLSDDLDDLIRGQEILYAARVWSVLIVFQAMDAAGKDGTIKHVMSGVNPQGCRVYSFKRPSDEELSHTFLWRCMKVLPERGQITIFNRSYYEEVLVVKVHRELLNSQRLPPRDFNKKFWGARYDDINSFEHHLTRNGTAVIKFFLNISAEEQRQRFLDRLNSPDKHWKFSTADVAERAHWDAYMKAYEEAIDATSTKWAPWYIIPANHKWVARAVVARIITNVLDSLQLRYPDLSPAERERLEDSRRQLETEGSAKNSK
jgi:PPK2 family polyphosphate:nucleotide phosphotransferase